MPAMKTPDNHALAIEVANANIDHFRRLMEAEADDARRAMLRRLLAEEKSKLIALTAAKPT